ncbi:(2Fe-2S)-binding protein [Monashia sp. NPDC004114]
MADDSVEYVVRQVDRALPFTTMTIGSSAATVWCDDVVAHVRAGADPLAPWRVALRIQLEQRHAAPVAPHIPAAFVLQWWCEVVATPLAYAAELGPWLLAPAPGGLGFELAPGLYPHRIVVDPDRAAVVTDPETERRRERARTAYGDLVSPVVAAFAPEVKMSSRQRWGVVDDMWSAAARLARGAAGESVGSEPRRVSCCFIFALPGMRECAACPRRAPEATHAAN